MVQAGLTGDVGKLHRRKALIISIKELMRDMRKDGEIWVNRAKFELSLANQLGTTLKMIQILMRELEILEYIVLDKEQNEIILKKKLENE